MRSIIADAAAATEAAPNSCAEIPEGSAPSAAQHPPAASTFTNGGVGLINGSLAQQQPAYALIISSIFNIHNALLISDAPQQPRCFLLQGPELEPDVAYLAAAASARR